MKFYFLLFLILLLQNVIFSNAVAYPNFIGHGYNSCITCHYNPNGNGPINDYGRAVSGTAIGSRLFYDENKPEELIGKESGFFFKEMINKHFRPFVGYRGLLIRKNLGQETADTEYIHMQADANLVIKLGSRDQFLLSGTFGYAPIPATLQGSKAADSIEEFRSREHYIAWRIVPSFGVYAGLLDKTFGLRVVEHTSYSRTTPQLTMNDQAHGVILHYNNPAFESSLNYFVGNMAQKESLRMKGFAGTFEATVAEKHRIGLSVMDQKNNFLKIKAFAAHLRSGLSGGNSILFEVGEVSKTVTQTLVEKKEMYGLLQNHIETGRGVYVLNSVEYYKNLADSSHRIRFGPGIQFFPMSKVEFRFDVYNTRNFTTTKSSNDRWDIMGQIHLWL